MVLNAASGLSDQPVTHGILSEEDWDYRVRQYSDTKREISLVKVLQDMLGEASGATYTAPTYTQVNYPQNGGEGIGQGAAQQQVSRRTILDNHHWKNFDLALFYEDKKLCLELTEGLEHKRVGYWTFCDGSRHIEHVQLNDDISVDVAYRPAHIAVSFCESVKGLKRWIRPTDRVHWSEYRIRPDGLVSVTRPGEENVVG